MTPDKQRIAIAESQGFVWYRSPVMGLRGPKKFLAHPGIQEYEDQSPQWKVRSDGTESTLDMGYMAREFHIPDYLNDLNAMHEAEKNLSHTHIKKYASNLWAVMHLSPQAFIGLIHATAAQRAEALLRTIGKWEES